MPVPTLKRADDLGESEAFGRDTVLEAMVRRIVAEYGIQTVVETGAWRGYTTRRFASFVPHVHTIELDAAMVAETMRTVADLGNVSVWEGNSADVLSWLPGTLAYHPVLYWLDAHWGAEWPLFDEIDAIAAKSGPCVIVIHDCLVPGTTLGYDVYGGCPLTFELVKPNLDRLPFSWRHFYNDESAVGHRRGALFVVPDHAATNLLWNTGIPDAA